MEGAENVDLAMSFIQSEMGEEVHDSEEKSQETLREQDRFLPIANVARIMKKEIPKTGKEKRKTINGEDILWAMNALGFENYVEPLKLYLQKYREANKGEKEGGIEGSFEADYNTITSFGTEHVNQTDIITGYGGPSQQLSTPFSL
ncbi:Nuclear transcription factor Y subunit beta [Armadillidium nasatum]|uniref:Nuclear transcription factor Y subunit beta n=1 Tax=Armadillidium nasatum TaxID=96803 RepID=A0A5N5TK80_9CRUS|nr:Nuclear transcription factor Y subunit beta [Armadillidium nasatum]